MRTPDTDFIAESACWWAKEAQYYYDKGRFNKDINVQVVYQKASAMAYATALEMRLLLLEKGWNW